MPTIANSRITKTPDIQGGDACIAGTRIPVWVLEGYRRLGWSEARLLEAYPSLNSADIAAAWVYVAENRDEIDNVIRENEEDERDLLE